jgi:hypothetical protein
LQLKLPLNDCKTFLHQVSRRQSSPSLPVACCPLQAGQQLQLCGAKSSRLFFQKSCIIKASLRIEATNAVVFVQFLFKTLSIDRRDIDTITAAPRLMKKRAGSKSSQREKPLAQL